MCVPSLPNRAAIGTDTCRKTQLRRSTCQLAGFDLEQSPATSASLLSANVGLSFWDAGLQTLWGRGGGLQMAEPRE